MFSAPVSYNAPSVNIGIGYSSYQQQLLPMISLSIPFGNVYHFQGSIGASKDNVFNEALSMMRLGIGIWKMFPERTSFWYAFTCSVRDYRTLSYGNLVIGVDAMLGKTWEKIVVAAGVDLSLQHHQIHSSNIVAAVDERVYTVMPKIEFRSPYGNISLLAAHDMFTANLSWTLNLE